MRKELEKLVEQVMQAADEKHGPRLRSAHEGYAILKEEVEELEEEVQSMRYHLNQAWTGVRLDAPDQLRFSTVHLRDRALRAAEEALQVAGVCSKIEREIISGGNTARKIEVQEGFLQQLICEACGYSAYSGDVYCSKCGRTFVEE